MKKIKEAQDTINDAQKLGKFDECKPLEDLLIKAAQVNPLSKAQDLRDKFGGSKEQSFYSDITVDVYLTDVKDKPTGKQKGTRHENPVPKLKISHINKAWRDFYWKYF